MTKAELRQEVKRQKKALGFQELKAVSAQLAQRVQGSEPFKQARHIGTYMALPDEVNLAPLLQNKDKTFYIPAFNESCNGYRMAQWTPALRLGKFGIHEPVDPVWADPDELDLILVPGIAFDRLGNRLGRGGGFYDQMLPEYQTVRIGVGFDFQCVEKIPTEPHDCPLDGLLTESQLLNFLPNG